MNLEIGDIIVLKPETGATGKRCILNGGTLDSGYYIRMGNLETNNITYASLKEEWIEKILKPDLKIKNLIQEVGLSYAVMIHEGLGTLPDNFLDTLSSPELDQILKNTGSLGFDEELQKSIEKILKKRGFKTNKKKVPLTSKHVRNVCKMFCGEETCSFLIGEPEAISCAKTENLGLCKEINQRRLIGSITAMGDYCPGRTGSVSIFSLSP